MRAFFKFRVCSSSHIRVIHFTSIRSTSVTLQRFFSLKTIVVHFYKQIAVAQLLTEDQKNSSSFSTMIKSFQQVHCVFLSLALYTSMFSKIINAKYIYVEAVRQLAQGCTQWKDTIAALTTSIKPKIPLQGFTPIHAPTFSSILLFIFCPTSALWFLCLKYSTSNPRSPALPLPHRVRVSTPCTVERHTLLHCYMFRYLQKTVATVLVLSASIPLPSAGIQHRFILYSIARLRLFTCKYNSSLLLQLWSITDKVSLVHIRLQTQSVPTRYKPASRCRQTNACKTLDTDLVMQSLFYQADQHINAMLWKHVEQNFHVLITIVSFLFTSNTLYDLVLAGSTDQLYLFTTLFHISRLTPMYHIFQTTPDLSRQSSFLTSLLRFRQQNHLLHNSFPSFRRTLVSFLMWLLNSS